MQKPNKTETATMTAKINLGDLSGWVSLNIGRAHADSDGTIACMPGNGFCVPSYFGGVTPNVSGNASYDAITLEAVQSMHAAWTAAVAKANSKLPAGHSIIVGSVPGKGPQIFVNTL